MTRDKDKIQQAADALEALGAGPSPDGPAQEPASQVPAPPAAPEAPAAPPVPVAPVKPALRKLPPLAKAQLNRKMALRRTMIPILLTTGLAMVLLGIWSVVVLVGGGDPFTGAETSQTAHLARLMLLAWPIAVVLLGGTAYLMYEVYTHYQVHPSQPEANEKRH